ncbi:MAG: sodium-dependent transporter [Rikenellaceae bacterium]
MENKNGFATRFGTLVVVGGSVVGLGNIWRFPYIAGENGGGAFIIIYILTTLIIAMPMMLCELSLGRNTRSNVFGAFKKLDGHKWRFMGLLTVLSAFFVISFYAVIAGWSFEFIFKSISGHFIDLPYQQVRGELTSFIDSGIRPIIWALLYIFATAAIVIFGVQKGIERISKILMPVFFVLIVCLAAYSLTLDGAKEGLAFLFKPDFSKVTGRTVLQAVGQAFFSLSIGLGSLVTYGAYIHKSVSLRHLAVTIVSTDTVVAILSGLVIFPAIFTFGISSSSGPDLIYITLPTVFGSMQGGHIISTIFFILVFIAAITSSISILEMMVSYLVQERKMTRRKAVIIASAASAVLAVICSLSMATGSKLKLMGMPIFDFLNDITASYMMPINAIVVVIFMGWIAHKALFKELTNGATTIPWWYKPLLLLIKFGLPAVIFLIILNG